MHLIIIVLVRANHGPRHSDRTNTCRIVLDDFHRGWARLVADDALSLAPRGWTILIAHRLRASDELCGGEDDG